MEDEYIVDLYWKRDEAAIKETEKKYAFYLFKIAYNILSSREDAQESINDTYLKAWNSMPPHRPRFLSTYLGKITREHSIDLYRSRHRLKRRTTEYSLSLSELESSLSSGNTTEESFDLHLLTESINTYLFTLPPQSRTVFISRYYYMDSLKEIARAHEISLSSTKSLLFRIRQGLRTFLEQEGFEL